MKKIKAAPKKSGAGIKVNKPSKKNDNSLDGKKPGKGLDEYTLDLMKLN